MSIQFLALFVSQENFEIDIFQTSSGELKITFIGHGTLMMEFDGKTIHIDPVGRYADYSKMPKADLILITHEHGDHLDADAISKIKKESTKIALTKNCFDQFGSGTVLNKGDAGTFAGIKSMLFRLIKFSTCEARGIRTTQMVKGMATF